ncbi:membrane protein [Labrys miyagiensis]|uniref:Small-conductance mechanosensitive channel n=1 Tax=Labrys miyagiensis TaxID=346912 RepID=A0ABQ6CW36_9HYPH|nr:mechanosensitive ion channel family protein [Labrys miyagiensis]GLS22934.1 membrane protein [Labrys miyagiensis]
MPGDQHELTLILINVMGLFGILVWLLQGRRRHTARLVVQIAFFSGMTLALVVGDVSPYRLDQTNADEIGALLGRSALVLWWMHLAWTIIGAVRLYMAYGHRPREAHLLLDLVSAVVYLSVTLSIVGFVFDAPIGTLVATSGVVAVIIGLALQNTLGDVFSSIALTLERPYVLGDWIQLGDGTSGRVVETNWRSTHLLTGAYDLVVLPNSVLAKLGLTNRSRPDEAHQMTLVIRIAALQRPHVIENVMRNALLACKHIVMEPPPVVALQEIDAAAIKIELQFAVANPASRTPARNEVIDQVYLQCKHNHLALAMPPESYRLPLYAPDGGNRDALRLVGDSEITG